MFTNSKWELLRKAYCPVMIVRPNASSHRKVILAALNIQTDKEEYIAMNENIIANGKRIADIYGAEVYVINAYKDSMH